MQVNNCEFLPFLNSTIPSVALKELGLVVVVGALEGLETGMLDLVEFGVASDGFLEGLDTGTLDLVVPGVVFAVVLVT